MLSSRLYYNNEPEFFRRSESGMRMSLGQHSPLIDSYDNASQLSRSTTASSEADKSGVAPRKRVPVACERCRKRKIKCSGDQGGGGCTNCLQAGVNSCQFLRVASIGASEIMQRAMYGRSMRYSPYPYASPYRSYTSSHASYNPQTPHTYQPMANALDYSSYNAPHNLPWSRSGSYSNTFSPYESESTSPFSTQPPSFMLPSTDPMSNGNSYLVNPYGGKSQPSQSWSDQPASALTSSQSSSSLMNTGYALPSSDALMTFQSSQGTSTNNQRVELSLPDQTLNSHQPTTLGSDRILPNPYPRFSTSTAFGAGERQSVDNVPPSAASHRSSLGSLGWQTDTASSASGISSQTSCSSVGGSQDFGADRPTMAYGCLGFDNGQQASLHSNSLNSNTGDSQFSQCHLANVATELSSQRYRTVSNDSPEDSPSNTSSTYGYTAVTRNGQARTTSGALSNGATYARAHSSIARREPQECGAECTDCQPGSSRASIASINNLSSY